jgi:hypothetical protein
MSSQVRDANDSHAKALISKTRVGPPLVGHFQFHDVVRPPVPLMELVAKQSQADQVLWRRYFPIGLKVENFNAVGRVYREDSALDAECAEWARITRGYARHRTRLS